MITIFVSKTSNTLNRQPYDIENITPFLCLNPMYASVKIHPNCEAMFDSGAFQNEDSRVTLKEALDRQKEMQTKCGCKAKYIVAYDKINDVDETMIANIFLLGAKLGYNQQKVLLVQGKTIEEYSGCLRELLKLSERYHFVMGFGGIAKCGINKEIENKLFGAIEMNKGGFKYINHIHLFGVFTRRVLKRVEDIFPDKKISCDTASIEIRSIMGNVFCEGEWRKTYTRAQKYIDYNPNLLAKDNVRRAINYYGPEQTYRNYNLCCGV